MMVPYESQKREKIHIFYIVHLIKISPTESRGSRSFFILKSGVHFSFRPFFNFAYSMTPTLKLIFPEKGSRVYFDFYFFSYTRGSSFMPPIHFWGNSSSISNQFVACSGLCDKLCDNFVD